MKRTHFPQLMVSVAQNRTLPELLRTLVCGIAECRAVVLTRIWLIQPGDICSSCRFRSECPDQTRCLHLVSSAGNPSDDNDEYAQINGGFRRFPLGVRKIGRVGQSGEALLLPGIRGDEDWIAEPAWIQREQVKTFAAQPLVFRGQVLGVLALFDTGVLESEDFQWLRVFADHAAVSIVNARAFEEIAALKERLELENDYLREEVTAALGAHDIVGNSPGLKKVLQQIQLVAPTDAAVLIQGESGTGKELVARAIHENSPRKGRALIKVNCGAIPENLFESEFFGHMRGAFTGAVRDKPGRFELADGGTLFLDEIGELPLAVQAKLLRVLQEQEVERVGDVRVRKVNVRIVAATNRDLEKEVEAGRFRQDLFYRLGVLLLKIPPLRERREDIAPLAEHFIHTITQRLNRPTPRFTKSHAEQLSAYDWPGNIRELQNTIERSLILSQRGPLQLEMSGNRGGAHSAPNPEAGATPQLLTREAQKRLERDSIVSALKTSGGKIFGEEGAARMLGMKPTTLASRIKALKIQRGRHGRPQV
jgi:transcriptional regulator with GAF, ATPase, and Fis domain